MCCSRLTAWPKVFLQMLQPKGLIPLWDLLTWTSSPWGVENTCRQTVGTSSRGPILLLGERREPDPSAHLVAGDAVVGVGSGGVVGAAVQGLLRLRAAADVGAVQAAGVLQDRGAEAQLAEIVGGSQLIPGERRLAVRRVLGHVRFCGEKNN